MKFKDADLIGIPVRITIGKRSIAEKSVEIKLRAEADSSQVPIESAVEKTVELVINLKEKLQP